MYIGTSIYENQEKITNNSCAYISNVIAWDFSSRLLQFFKTFEVWFFFDFEWVISWRLIRVFKTFFIPCGNQNVKRNTVSPTCLKRRLTRSVFPVSVAKICMVEIPFPSFQVLLSAYRWLQTRSLTLTLINLFPFILF